MSKKIDIVVCSAGLYKDSVFKRGYENLNGKYTLNFIEKNDKPIYEVYNNHLNGDTDADYIIFCHDDVSIEDSMLSDKIDRAIGDDSEYAICGVAGSSKFYIQNKNLWHTLGDSNNRSGAVAHYTGKDDTQIFMTNFGITPVRCIVLDGLFLAINVKKIRQVGLTFDEECPAKYNFYDLNFCIQAHKLGLKMTTYPIWLVHKSHGYYNNDDWVKGNEYFKNKWS